MLPHISSFEAVLYYAVQMALSASITYRKAPIVSASCDHSAVQPMNHKKVNTTAIQQRKQRFLKHVMNFLHRILIGCFLV